MKAIISFLSIICVMLVFASPRMAEESKHFEIVVDGATYELNSGESIEVKNECGKTMNISLNKKPYVIFQDSFISFQYNSDLSPSVSRIEEGLSQIMLNTATGTAVMIQEYSNLDPEMLVPMLLKELTKELVEYGYEKTQTEIEREIASGKKMTGIKATMSYMDQESYYEVLSYSERDMGIVVVTMIDKSFINEKEDIIDRFWNTVTVQF